MAEQVLSGSHRTGIELSQSGQKLVVEGIARFFVPKQRVIAEHFRVRNRRLQVETPIGVDGQLRFAADLLQHRLDPLAIFFQRRAAYLHLHH